jgi:glucose-1-phosphate thymidylyltransferase
VNHINSGRRNQREIIGVIPAGGQGTRLGPLPLSKEIYPIGYDPSREGRPKAVCNYLLDKMRSAGIKKAYIVLRGGKWDIPTYLKDGKMLGMNLAYLIMDSPFGVPFTIDQAFPFVQNNIIAFGFPDILFKPDDVFVRLLDRLTISGCDAVLGLFPTDRPHNADLVDFDVEGRIINLEIKPSQTNLHFTWGAAVWSPIFSQFIHSYVTAQKPFASEKKELSMSEVVKAAIDNNLRVEAVHVSDEPFLDIGTPEGLLRAAKQLLP